jgi:hypothetical protein
MNWNLVGSIYGISFIKLARFVPIHYQTSPPSELNGHLYRGPSKDSSYQVLIHLARRFQRWRLFRNQPIKNKNCLWRPCLLTDGDEMCNRYREPSVDASYQVSVQLAKRFQRWWFIKNRPIRNKNCLWRPCLLMDRDKTKGRILGRSSIKMPI